MMDLISLNYLTVYRIRIIWGIFLNSIQELNNTNIVENGQKKF
jgi:hypothetical protein